MVSKPGLFLPPSVSPPSHLYLSLPPCFSCLPLPCLPSPWPLPPLPSHTSFHLPHPSIHPPISAQGGLALLLSDVWKCQQCEGTGTGQPDSLWSCWVTVAHETDWQADSVRGKRSPLGSPLMAQYIAPSNLTALSFFLLVPSVSFCLFSLLLFVELPPGWEKIDDPVYGVYYVE